MKHGLVRHILLAFGPVALAFATGIVTVPIILTTLGPDAWAAVAVGQAVGYLGAQVVQYGWGTVGPTAVAALGTSEGGAKAQAQYVADSIGPRLWLLLVGLPLASAVAYAVAPPTGHTWLTVLQAAALMAGGLNGMYYYTGSARPDLTILFDALPRAAFTIAGLGLLILTHEMAWYIALQFACDLLLIAFVVGRARRFGARVDLSLGHARHELIEHRDGVALSLAGNASAQGPLAIVSAFQVPGIATYALVDKILRYGQGALGPLVMTAQGRLHSPDRAELKRRVRAVNRASIVAGVAMGALFVAVGGWVARLLSHGEISAPWTLTLPFGVALMCIVIMDMVGSASLLALGGARAAATSAVVAAVVGLPAVALAAWLGGTHAAAWAVAGMGLVALAWQWVAVELRLREQ